MSADNQGASAGTTDTPKDAGPVEITLIAPETPKVETPAPKADVTDVTPKAEKTTTETTNDSEIDEIESNPDNRDNKGRFKPGVQARIDELTRSRREAEREAAYWKARAQGPDTAQPPAQPAATFKPPVQTDYATPEEYQDALVDYKVEQKLAQKDNQKSAEKAVTERAASWQSRLESARTAIPDFNDVMDAAEVPVAKHVADLIFEHELGANIAYHFAKNPDLLDKLNSMSPAKAAFEIGKLGDKLEAAAAPANGTDKSDVADSAKPVVKVVEKPTSKAPPPASTIGQGRTMTPSLDEMSMEDYVAQRNLRKYGRAA